MKITNLFFSIFVVILISCGQILYKFASNKFDENQSNWLLTLIFNSYFIAAVFLYALASGLWVYVIRNMPLSFAYPITALAYFFVPLLSYLFLGETLRVSTFIGATIIAFGVYISSIQGT